MGEMNMNNNLSYRVERDILYLQIKGQNTIDDILGLYERAFADKSTPQKVSIIVDARSSETVSSNEDIERFVNGLRKFSQRIIRQAVVISTDRQFGDTRQASFFAEFDDYEVQPFREVELAIEWIEPALMGVCGVGPFKSE